MAPCAGPLMLPDLPAWRNERGQVSASYCLVTSEVTTSPGQVISNFGTHPSGRARQGPH